MLARGTWACGWACEQEFTVISCLPAPSQEPVGSEETHERLIPMPSVPCAAT